MTKDEFKVLKEARLSEYLKPSAMAYRDFCRTIRKRASVKEETKKDVKKSTNILGNRFNETIELIGERLKIIPISGDQKEFDEWHNSLCNSIRDTYNKNNEYTSIYEAFEYGQAQKWVNMTLKNMYLLCDDVDESYEVMHVPVDKIILMRAFSDNEPAGLGIKTVYKTNGEFDLNQNGDAYPWSRWKYDDYNAFQMIVRKRTREVGYKCVMDWEFEAWKLNS